MSIEPAVFSLLVSDSSITNIVGTSPSRIYYVNKLQNITSASIILELITTDRALTFGGATGYSGGVLRINCFDTTYQKVKTLGNAVRALLHGYSGVSASTTVDFIKITSDSDIPLDPADGRGQQQIYGVTLDADYMVKES